MPAPISPLARKLCAAKGIAPESLRGSGPRGRIMAADVREPAPAEPSPTALRCGGTAMNSPAMLPTRPPKDGYYVYDAEVDMKALADISQPIAVQCEKLLEQRYSLFDYLVRAVVKACCLHREWMPASGKVDALLFEQEASKLTALIDVADKSIYRLTREAQAHAPMPEGFMPHIIICDSLIGREQVAARVTPGTHPTFAFVARGETPKEGIRAGGADKLTDFGLPYTFYIAQSLPSAMANGIAARLQTLLVDPVSLLLLD